MGGLLLFLVFSKRGARMEGMEKAFQRTIIIEGIPYSYIHILSSSRHRSFSLSFDQEGNLLLRTPFRYSEASLQSFLLISIPKLVKKKKAKEKSENPLQDGYLFLFGKRQVNKEFSLLAKLDRERFLEKELLAYLRFSFPKWEKKIGNSQELHYDVKDLKTAYGIFHPKTRLISFSSVLAHYHPHIIDSVIAHELTHDFVRGHGKAFYVRLLNVFPDYYECRKALIHHDFEGKNHFKKQ